MIINDELLEVLAGYTQDKRVFTKNEIDLYQAIGGLAADTIKNSINFKRIRGKI